jgi:hypothetical protein
VALQALPLYSVPNDGVAMVTVAATAGGRIFMGGAGGRAGGWVDHGAPCAAEAEEGDFIVCGGL